MRQAVFFLDSGLGHELTTPTMECENLQGWLVPKQRAAEFEAVWMAHEKGEWWEEFYYWAEWHLEEDGTVTVEFT